MCIYKNYICIMFFYLPKWYTLHIFLQLACFLLLKMSLISFCVGTCNSFSFVLSAALSFMIWIIMAHLTIPTLVDTSLVSLRHYLKQWLSKYLCVGVWLFISLGEGPRSRVAGSNPTCVFYCDRHGLNLRWYKLVCCNSNCKITVA